MTDWSQALCLGKPPEWWFDRPQGQCNQTRLNNKSAEALCAECPIRVDCYRYAVKNREHHGLWGGIWMDRDVLERNGRNWFRLFREAS